MAAVTAASVGRLLQVIEEEVVPLTAAGVKAGNKLFGAAILKKDDLSTVIAATNNETQNPLWHGEVHAIKLLYELPAETRPSPRDCVFVSTHEPCPMCLSAITWGGYDNFVYLFSYQDSRDSFNIPHDLKIMKEVFQPTDGSYARENFYWKSGSIEGMIRSLSEDEQAPLLERIVVLEGVYKEMSDVYQQLECMQASKGENQVPLP